MILLHLGKLHPYEHVLVYLIAFGPFLLLALTVWISRRRARDEELDAADGQQDSVDESPSH